MAGERSFKATPITDMVSRYDAVFDAGYGVTPAERLPASELVYLRQVNKVEYLAALCGVLDWRTVVVKYADREVIENVRRMGVNLHAARIPARLIARRIVMVFERSAVEMMLAHAQVRNPHRYYRPLDTIDVVADFGKYTAAVASACCPRVCGECPTCKAWMGEFREWEAACARTWQGDMIYEPPEGLMAGRPVQPSGHTLSACVEVEVKGYQEWASNPWVLAFDSPSEL